MWKAIIIAIFVLMLIPMVFWVNNAEPNETPAQYTAKVVRTSFYRGFDDFEHLKYIKEEEATRGGENIKPAPVKTHPLIPPVTEDITVTEDE